MDGWNTSFLYIGMAYFQGRTVKLREGIEKTPRTFGCFQLDVLLPRASQSSIFGGRILHQTQWDSMGKPRAHPKIDCLYPIGSTTL